MFQRYLLPQHYQDGGNKPIQNTGAISTTTQSTKAQQTAMYSHHNENPKPHKFSK
jgi:hypothetical protein